MPSLWDTDLLHGVISQNCEYNLSAYLERKSEGQAEKRPCPKPHSQLASGRTCDQPPLAPLEGVDLSLCLCPGHGPAGGGMGERGARCSLCRQDQLQGAPPQGQPEEGRVPSETSWQVSGSGRELSQTDTELGNKVLTTPTPAHPCQTDGKEHGTRIQLSSPSSASASNWRNSCLSLPSCQMKTRFVLPGSASKGQACGEPQQGMG